MADGVAGKPVEIQSFVAEPDLAVALCVLSGGVAEEGYEEIRRRPMSILDREKGEHLAK